MTDKRENRMQRKPDAVRLARRLAWMLAVALVCGGCAKSQPGPDPNPTPTAAATEETGQPTTATTEASTMPSATADPSVDATFVKPDPAIRPVAVMIDNQGDRPLPQAGIRQAQIVYEVLTEYRITRYLAFFWGGMPEMVGPVRSSRHYFLDFAMEYDAVYTHYGWSPQAQKDIRALKIQNVNGLVNGDAFWDTDKDRGNWQDSFTSKEKVDAQIARLKYRSAPTQTFPFTYADVFAVPATGDAATKVDLTYGKGFTAGYAYNATTCLYERTRNGVAQMERNTGLQVTPRNILVEVVPSAQIAGDEKYRINVATVGKGAGWFITGGKSRKITWEKKARNVQTIYLFEDGSPLVLNPGQMWVEVIPTASCVTIG